MHRRIPTREECSVAVARAVSARRRRAHANPQLSHYTPVAIEERVTGIAMTHPRRGRDGWWLVGVVVDDFEALDPEFDVWFRAAESGARQLGMSHRKRTILPPPPPQPTRYFCGLRLAWIDAETGAIIGERDEVDAPLP